MSFRVQADLNGSGAAIVVANARNALIVIKELVDLGYSDVVTTDFEGRIVNRARLETEAASETQPGAGGSAVAKPGNRRRPQRSTARKLPLGPARNDLRQLARGLVNLHRLGVRATFN
jgi:hypothetical protein